MKNLIAISILFLFTLVSCDKIKDLISKNTYGFDKSFELKINQNAKIEPAGMDVAFKRVLEDSRCPTSVVCVWEGRAVVELELKRDGATILDTLATKSSVPNPPDSTFVFGHKVKLLEVNPYPKTPNSINEKDYSVRLIVYK